MKRRAFFGLAPALALAGCASPPADYYRLAVVPGVARTAFAPTSAARIISVRGVSIPGYLDQTGIAKPSTGYEFGTYANELWAEPLADMLQAAMVQDLAQRLPAATVIAAGGAIGAPPAAFVEINVQQFDFAESGDIVLKVQFSVKAGGGGWTTQNYAASAPAGTGVTGTVAAMSTLWGEAADQVAAALAQPSP